MKVFEYTAEQVLPVPVHKAWSFFSSANNLALITPPNLDFKILTKLNNDEIYEGMLIDYIVRPLFGIPVRWTTEIVDVHKPFLFTDKQLKGPYKMWEHTHTFQATTSGTLMKDVVRYQMPMGIIGHISHSLIVRKRIEEIFAYRKKILTQLFNNHGKDNS